MVRLLALAAAVVAAPLVGCAMFQDRLLYFPSTLPLAAVESEASTLGARPWPDGGAAHRGFVVEPRNADCIGTAIVFHGNAGHALDRMHWADALGRLGWRTILAEYPGYGARDGAVGERSFVPDALETVRLAHAAFGDPIVLAGESLGAGVAGAVAAQTDVPILGILLVTPWADLPSLAQEKFPLIPVRLVLRDRYDTVANLAHASMPVAVCIAEQDDVVPSHHAERLYAALPGPKRRWTFLGRGHNDWPIGPLEPWWGEAMSFLAEPRTD